MTRCLISLFVFITISAQQDFKGKLDPELAVIPKVHMVYSFSDATDDQKKAVAENDLNWSHATHASISGTLKSLLIDTWPTYVLIDRKGKVITANQSDLSGKNLEATLAKLMP